MTGDADTTGGQEGEAPSLDLRGLKCPMPVLRTRKMLRALPTGTVLSVLCTDPLAGVDLPNLVRETGDAFLGAFAGPDCTVFKIRKAP